MSQISRFSSLVALPHSVFALPYALASFLIAAQEGVLVEFSYPRWSILLFVVVAVVSARTAAMAFNRLVDEDIDAKNPRTQNRELPSGALSRGQVWLLVVSTSIVFLGTTWLLGLHCLVLAPLVLFVLFGYSYSKRVTRYSHLVLGLSLGLAPAGAWWVIRPQFEWTPILLALGVMFWVAGFDTLYSCQDEEFDRKEGLHSMPSSIGVEASLTLAKLLHVITYICFLLVGLSADLESSYFLGVSVLSGLLVGQHLLISPKNLGLINHSFFTFNGLLSIGYFLLVAFVLG